MSIDDDRAEGCDDGAGNPDTAPDACRTNCVFATCGDGVTDTGESCDDGADNSDIVPDACRVDCSLPACGDGVTDTTEACDDGNNINADGCEADCSLPACQNGIDDPEDFQGDLCFFENTPAGFSPTSFDIKFADLDGDGFQDIVFGDLNGLSAIFGDGQGGVLDEVTIFSGSANVIEIGEFNGGGFLDISFTQGAFGSQIIVMENNGDRTFANTVNISLNGVIDMVSSDFDRDGDDDIIAATSGDDLILVRNAPVAGNPFFSSQASVIAAAGFSLAGDLKAVEVEDINGDFF